MNEESPLIGRVIQGYLVIDVDLETGVVYLENGETMKYEDAIDCYPDEYAEEDREDNDRWYDDKKAMGENI